MRRRALIVLAVGAAVSRASLALGQPAGKAWRIGWLGEGADPKPGPQRIAINPFVDGLRQLGYIEGQNLTMVFRFADARAERLPALAAELAGLKLDVIAAPGTREALALQQATSTIPIVMLFPGDPVGAGLVRSLASPGANITGTSLMFPDVGGKRLALLREFVPLMRRVAILGNPKNAATAADMRATEAAAIAMDLQVHTVGVETPDDLSRGFGEIMKGRADGLLVCQDNLVSLHRRQIAAFALENRLPSVFPGRPYVESGGLVGYGPSLAHVARRAAVYVDRILKGAKPADLPVEQPTHFDLTINLTTATALGLTIPPALLALADEVIE